MSKEFEQTATAQVAEAPPTSEVSDSVVDTSVNNTEAAEFPSVWNLIRKFDSLGGKSPKQPKLLPVRQRRAESACSSTPALDTQVEAEMKDENSEGNCDIATVAPINEVSSRPAVKEREPEGLMSDESEGVIQLTTIPSVGSDTASKEKHSVEEIEAEAASEAKAVTQPEAGSETVPEAKAVTQPEAGSETVPEAKAVTQPEAGSETVPEAKAVTQPEAGSETVPEAKAETQPEAQEEPAPEASAEIEPEPEDLKIEPEAEVETRPEAQANGGSSEADADTKPEADADTKPEADAGTQPEADADTQPEADADTKPEADADTKPEADADTELEATVAERVLNVEDAAAGFLDCDQSDEEVAPDDTDEVFHTDGGDTEFEEAVEELDEADETLVMRTATASATSAASASASESSPASASAASTSAASAEPTSEAEKVAASGRPQKAAAKVVSGAMKPLRKLRRKRDSDKAVAGAGANADSMQALTPKRRRPLLNNCARTLKNKVLDASRTMIALVSRADDAANSRARLTAPAPSGASVSARLHLPSSAISPAGAAVVVSAPLTGGSPEPRQQTPLSLNGEEEPLLMATHDSPRRQENNSGLTDDLMESQGDNWSERIAKNKKTPAAAWTSQSQRSPASEVSTLTLPW